VLGADEVGKGTARLQLFESERQNGHLLARRPFHFPEDLLGSIGVCREEKHEQASLFDGRDDRRAPFRSRLDVARCDPALDVVSLQPLARCFGEVLVSRRVAEEDVVSHAISET
jgi:hypothetical protein